MPHEIPNQAASGAANLNSKIPVEKNNPLNNKRGAEKIMTATDKENNARGTSSSIPKVPIPEHIHDTGAKTFYKLGEFLGKVRIVRMF